MKIAIGNDHKGYQAKLDVVKHLLSKGFEVFDEGCNSEESCDYPDYGRAVAEKVAKGSADYGVVICSSGEGISITANKVKGIRCGLAYNDETAELMRRHNDANVIGFGASFMDTKDIIRRVDIFLSTEFEGGRHSRRVEKIKELEK